MKSNEIHDYLKFSDDQQIKKLIRTETVLFSNKVVKINKYSISQERNILITNKAIYNLKKKELKRRIEISSLKGITVSSQSDEFVLHGKDIEYDYNYISNQKNLIIEIIASSYKEETGSDILFSDLDLKTLKNLVTQKEEKKKDFNFTRMMINKLSDVKEYCNRYKSSSSIKERSTIYSKNKKYSNVTINDFRVIKVLGRGSFGKVLLVEFLSTNELYAMKCLKKDVLLESDQIENTLLEKKILAEIEHPFLVGLVFCFQTEERIYFVLPFVSGGELFQHLKKYRVFDEEK